MSSNIRLLKRGDHQQWLELWRGYQDFYKADLSSGEGELFDRLLAPQKNGPFALVCERDKELLGLAHYLFHPSTWGQDRCYLNDLFSTPSARGSGVGRSLIEAVAMAARQHGASELYWMTQEFNRDARHLYDRLASKTPFVEYVMEL
jgi:GNAT superfamily N-acetyltransferase